MSRKTNKTITAVGMAALMTAAGVLTAMAAQSPTITAGNGMSQIEAVGPGVQSPDAEQEQAPIWGSIISADNGSIDMDCPSGNIYEGEVIVNISGDTLFLFLGRGCLFFGSFLFVLGGAFGSGLFAVGAIKGNSQKRKPNHRRSVVL